jgi:rare lipoprotein A
MNAMTCAHRTLPLGSLVRVTNLRNHRSLVLRVNDRGPMIESRVVDLSYAAAKRLGFSHRGTVRVRLDLVDARPSRTEVAMLTKPAM